MKNSKVEKYKTLKTGSVSQDGDPSTNNGSEKKYQEFGDINMATRRTVKVSSCLTVMQNSKRINRA